MRGHSIDPWMVLPMMGMILHSRGRPIPKDCVANCLPIRKMLADQVRELFATELATHGPDSQASVVAIVDSLASPQAWNVMCRSHNQTTPQIRMAWITTLQAVFAAGSRPTFADIAKD